METMNLWCLLSGLGDGQAAADNDDEDAGDGKDDKDDKSSMAKLY